MTNVYVGNLSYSISDTELEAMFAPYGTVERAKVITDRETGRARGFGFVEMPTTTRPRPPWKPSTATTWTSASWSSTKLVRDADQTTRRGGPVGNPAPSCCPAVGKDEGCFVGEGV